MRRGLLFLALASAAVWAWWPAPVPAQDSSSLDRQLLEDLDNDLLEGLSDDLEDASPAPKTASPGGQSSNEQPVPDGQSAPGEQGASPVPEGKRSVEDLGQDVGEDIGAPDVAADDEDPLIRIEQKMRQVQQRLAQHDASDQTQSIQEQIAKELALLLEQLRQQQQQNQNNQSSQSQQQSASSSQRQDQQQNSSSSPANQAANKPAEDSEERLGKVEEDRINPEDLQELFQRAWGHLPPQVREQMRTRAQEQFLPKYEVLIEEYFQRLAEEGR